MKEHNKNLIRIKTKDLRIGMFVVDIGAGWLRHPWKTKRKLISRQHDINQLLQFKIDEVTVDLALSKKIAFPGDDEYGLSRLAIEEAEKTTAQEVSRKIQVPPVRVEEPRKLEEIERRRKPRPEKPRDDVPLESELPRARQTYARALDVTRKFMEEARAGRQMDVEAVQENVDDMIDSVFRNRSSMVALLKLRKYDEYTFTHSLNVAALAVSLGRSADLSREQLMNLGLGAMFHDLGKTDIPGKILNKPGRLSDEEFEVMKGHPDLGEKILLKNHPNLSPAVFAIVRHHHERIDGTGYPDGLTASEIEPFVTICGISDVYDALSSDRVYRKGMLAHEALKVVFGLRNKHFSKAWVDRFVQCIGIYPVGTMVLLNTGECGLVMEVNPSSLIRPVVRVILDVKKRHVPGERVLDLNQPANEELDIINVIDPSSLGIDPASYFPV